MQKLRLDYFVRHGFNKDVRNWVHSCIACQQSIIYRHIISSLHNFVVPDNQFDHLHIDIIIGPLPSSRGQSYLFTIIIRFIRWPEAIPMLDATKETCVRGLLSGWVSRFGLPTIFTSDHALYLSQVSGVHHSMFCTLSLVKPHHTTHKPTARLNIYTTKSRPHSKPNCQTATG